MRYREIIDDVSVDPQRSKRRIQQLAARRLKTADAHARCADRMQPTQTEPTKTT
jgi:hypothetical protein